MKIAIFADLHDNLPNLEKFFNWCENNGVKTIIACGDISNSDTLSYLSDNFSGKIFLIRGNMDIYPVEQPADFSNIEYLGRYGTTMVAETKVGICHEPDFIDQCLKENPHIIFYGHTHKPWMEKKDNVELVNPGTLGGVFTRATFAYWDTEKGEMKLVVLDQIN